jgi:hypothetical protein
VWDEAREAGRNAYRKVVHVRPLDEDRPLIEWTAPSAPFHPRLYNEYLATINLPPHAPGTGTAWHEVANPEIAWYVWNGVHWEEAEQRVNAPSVHEKQMDFRRAVKERTPPEERHLWDRPDVAQHEHDLVRIIHAVESLGVLAESHPEYLGYYLVARETPIEFRNWWRADAEAQWWGPVVYVSRSELNDSQAELLMQLVHEMQHAYDWYWNRTIRRPLHSKDPSSSQWATPLEEAVPHDYIRAVRAGVISEEALPADVSRITVPKHRRVDPWPSR